MKSLRTFLNASPIGIFLYGVVSSAIEVVNTWVTLDSIRFGAGSSVAERWIAARAFVFSFDNFFFYTGLAALVAVAVRMSGAMK